nr:DNA replication complex GINS protein SLD5-like [Ipomoea trifida]
MAQQCGSEAGGRLCPSGFCCSQWGYCGTTSANCGPGCQSQCRPTTTTSLQPTPPPLQTNQPLSRISPAVPTELIDLILMNDTYGCTHADACAFSPAPELRAHPPYQKSMDNGFGFGGRRVRVADDRRLGIPDFDYRRRAVEASMAEREGCGEDVQTHFEESVLSKLPPGFKSHLKQSSLSEEDDTGRSKRFLGAFLLDDSGEDPVSIEADELYALPYRPLVENG